MGICLNGPVVKESACYAGVAADASQSPGQEDPLDLPLKQQPTPVLLPGESHGQRSQVRYSPWGRESEMTKRLAHTFSL